jgi:hypothetical protein
MADNRTISQLEAEGYPWIGCECCKGTVWVPFRMLRERIPMLSAMTLDQFGAKMKCDKCGKRPERYYPANQKDTPGLVRSFRCPCPALSSIRSRGLDHSGRNASRLGCPVNETPVYGGFQSHT